MKINPYRNRLQKVQRNESVAGTPSLDFIKIPRSQRISNKPPVIDRKDYANDPLFHVVETTLISDKANDRFREVWEQEQEMKLQMAR